MLARLYISVFLFLPCFIHTLSKPEPLGGAANRLGKPLIGDDGIIYACSEKFLYAFASNGSITWNIHLNYTCNRGIAPVYGGTEKVYIVAENMVFRINSLNAKVQPPVVELLFGNETAKERSDEIIGLAASMLTSSVYINIRSKGLYVYSLRGRSRWSVVPVLDQFGFSQGCKENATDCYFTSAPVIDDCETSIYISNNEGELYSISTRRPQFKWIQILKLSGKVMTATPGNNGFVYITVPDKAIVFALDVLTGDVAWDRGIGPLNSEDHLPVVDSNGWISIGSLDGFLYSISPTGILKKFAKASPTDSVIQVSPVLDCSGYAVYISQTQMEGKSTRVIGDYTYVSAMKPTNVVFSLLVPATEMFYWSETYPGQFATNLSQSDLHQYILDEQMVLAFIAAARIGNPISCRSTRLRISSSCSEAKPKSVSVYTGNERAILLFLLFETVILIILAISVRFCWIFWGKEKLQNQALGKFLERRHSLRLIKKEYDKTISELEQKAAEEATTSIFMDNLSKFVRRRKGIERKLSTTYSLGRDSIRAQQRNKLPIIDAKRSSFQGSKSEIATSLRKGDVAYSGDESSFETDYEQDSHREIELAANAKAKELVKMASGEDIEGNYLYDHYSSGTSSIDSLDLSYEDHKIVNSDAI